MYAKGLLSRRRRTRRTNRVRRTVRKRTVRTARRTTKAYTKVSRMPVPDRYVTTMRYSEGITFSCSSANVLYSYSLQSSIYDPDLTAAGHQPLWRDQYAAMFNRYRVFGIKYQVYCKNTNVAQLTVLAAQHSSSSTTDTSFNLLLERGTARYKFLDSNNSQSNYFGGYLSVPKVYGMSRTQFQADDGFDAAIGADPSKLAYLHLYALTRNTSADVNCQIILTYYVELFDRIQVSGS